MSQRVSAMHCPAEVSPQSSNCGEATIMSGT